MPRRKKGAPPGYRLHKATGQAVVTINRKDIYLGRYLLGATRVGRQPISLRTVDHGVGQQH